MKKTTLGFACLVAGIVGYFQLQPADAQAPTPIPSVWLQNSSPGTTQTGNFHVSGTGMIGRMLVNTAGLGAHAEIAATTNTALYIPVAAGGANGVYVNSTDPTVYPGVIGFVAGSINAGLWAFNYTTSSQALMSYGLDGIVATGGSGGYAGTFNGDVRIGNQLIVNMGSIGTSRIETSEANTNNVGIRAMNHGIGQSSQALFYYRPGAEFSGQNGMMAQTTVGNGAGVVGLADGPNGGGVLGTATDSSGVNFGVYGSTASFTSGYGVYSSGNFAATGTKSFRIDHPRDPENKYLLHYCTEGEKPLNAYQGEVTTDATGYATVALPDYFDDINRNARVQLTVVDMSDSDDFALVKQVSPVQNAAFRIRTSVPNTRVAWEVKAERWDLFVRTYGAPVEVQKPASEKGTYQHPELYGKGPEKGRIQNREAPRPEVRRPSVISVPKPVRGPGSVRLGK